MPTTPLTGLPFRLEKLRTLLQAWSIARSSYPSLTDAFSAFRGLLSGARQNARLRLLAKGLVIDGKVYTLMGMPGRPSPAWNTVIKNELHRHRPIPGYAGGLQLLLFAITKKCPLRCEHCFEWDSLNHKETLSLADILNIVAKYQASGVAQIELSGGEPLNRFADLLEVLRRSDTQNTDFWLLTSGYQLSPQKALQLKSAGLRGVSISLDHWNEVDHDRFRGVAGSYYWALQAARNSLEARLLTGLSLVATRDFCTPENLWRYAELAHALQVHFIRLLEPRAAGHYAGLSVELRPQELDILENFVRQIQHGKAFLDYPLLEYHAGFQREAGCMGAGKRYLYIDTDGDLHACPFCQRKCGSAAELTVAEGRAAVQALGCPAF